MDVLDDYYKHRREEATIPWNKMADIEKIERWCHFFRYHFSSVAGTFWFLNLKTGERIKVENGAARVMGSEEKL